MTKKRKIIIFSITALAVILAAALVFFAILYVSEHWSYKAQTNTFAFTDTGSIKKTVELTANGGTATVDIANLNTADNDKNYNYAVIIVPSELQYVSSLTLSAGTRYSYGVEGYTQEPEGAAVYGGIDARATASVTITNNAQTSLFATVYVVRDAGHNYYVGSYFDLQMSRLEIMHNFGTENTAQSGAVTANTEIVNGIWPFADSGDSASVYVISSFTIPEDFTYNVPCFLNLLDFNITLQGALTISHGYSGLYSIGTLTGKIDNAVYPFEINTPNAYYKTEGSSTFNSESIVTTLAKFTKTSENIDLTASVNSAIKAAVLSDAEGYVRHYLCSTMFEGSTVYYAGSSVILPQNYYNYGIRYAYTSANSAFHEGGAVVRAAQNVTGEFKAFVYFRSDAAATATYSHNVCVVGNDAPSVREAYLDALGVYAVKRQPVGDLLTQGNDIFAHGVDIKAFTEAFASQTLVANSSPLDALTLYFQNSQLYFETVYGNNLSATSTTATISYNGGTIGLSGIESTKSIIIKHDYYISSATDYLCGSFSSSQLATQSPITFIGISIEERNAFLSSIMPQFYIGSANTSFKVVNVRENGVFVGPAETGKKESPTNLSISSMGYSMFYMNEAALSAVEAIDASSLTRVQKSSAMAALLANDTSNQYLSKILTDNGIATPICAAEYSGKQLLGDSAAHFSFDGNGTLTMNSESFVVYNGVLALISKTSYDDGESGYFYYLTRTLYSPASGLGGTDLSYTESGMFTDIFSPDKNWIGAGTQTIQSTDSARYVKSITYTVTTPSAGVQTSCDYFSIAETAENSHIFTMSVTKENIPRENSIVAVTVVITDGSTDITENYSFIIPGVYLYGKDIDNIWIYLRMAQVYGETSGYLRVDDVKAAKAEFDCSFATLNTSVNSPNGYAVNIEYLVKMGIISSVPQAPQAGSTLSLEGIQYAVGTRKMVYDNIQSASLAPFAKFETNTLAELSLSNCGVTNEKLTAGYPLYALNKLVTVNLSANTGITSLNRASSADGSYILYRTVSSLNIDSCAVTDITGIQSLVQLKNLQCRSNQIKNFAPLCELGSLSTVYLGSNLSAGGYYGTHGYVNICNIVSLIHKNVSVYTATDTLVRIYEKSEGKFYFKGNYTPSSELSDAIASAQNILQQGGYLITLEQEFLSVSAMSFFNFEKYVADVADTSDYSQAISVMFPSSIYEYTTGGADYYTVSVEDVTGSSTATTRTYRLYIQFNTASQNQYRFGTSDYYPATGGGVPSDGYMRLYREITFDVVLV